MVINKETDYALRILRALTDGELHTAGQLSQEELLPQAFKMCIRDSPPPGL